jgi:hypothetical protein
MKTRPTFLVEEKGKLRDFTSRQPRTCTLMMRAYQLIVGNELWLAGLRVGLLYEEQQDFSGYPFRPSFMEDELRTMENLRTFADGVEFGADLARNTFPPTGSLRKED